MTNELSAAARSGLAEILRCDRESDMARVRGLKEDGCEAIDTLHAQLLDLMRTREPRRKLDDAQAEQAVAAFLAERGSAYGAWVHYPWSRRLVRVLEEAEFVSLRTDRNRHKITAAEQARLWSKKIGVVGLSVGQSVALTLASERNCGELRLADFDTVELSNLNRLRCGVHELGLPKTVVAARQIAEMDPYLKVVCFDRGYAAADAEAFLHGLDAVVDECDSLDVKLQLREAARSRGIPVLMNTSDRGMTDIERFDLEPDRPLFHGRLGAVAPASLAGLSTEEKIPVVLDIIGLETSSLRLRASMLEIEQSIKTWPQLASDVALGGAVITDVVRRLMLGEPVRSGRYYFDLSEVGKDASAPASVPAQAPVADAPHRSRACARARDGDVRDRIVADASLAPSAGNAQPWEWIKTQGGLLLRHRRSAGRSMLYHEDRAAMVGLGATLESALLSARHHAHDAEVQWRWRGDDIAFVALAAASGEASDALYPQLFRRRSVRARPSEAAPIAQTALDALDAQARRFPGVETRFLTDRKAIGALAELVGAAERLRILDPESHADMVNEIAWSNAEHRRDGEGIPMQALSLSAAEVAGLKVLADARVVARLADWRLGGGLGKLAHDLVASSSAMGLIWSPGDSCADYLRGGRALQRVWLEAANWDIGLCPVTSLCYLLRALRRGGPMTAAQTETLSALEQGFRELLSLPQDRGDIALFRLLPAAGELDRPRATHRRDAFS
ncbi:Rv1355c family protein [Luteimonas gilva]|nr:Rv1355c family protein [Luteimonas gilva]